MSQASVQNGSSSLRRGDSRRAKDQDVDTSDSDFERGGSFRRPRRSALKRPEIPDIFRHKTAVTNLDSVIGGGDLKDIGASRESSRLVTPNNPPPAFRTLSSSAAVPQTPCSPSFSSTCGSLGSTNGVDRYASKFGQKEDGTAWWEVIKRPPNVPFSNLNVVSAPKGVSCGAGGRNLPRHTTNDLQTHTLKVNVGGTGGGLNGKSDGNVSDTLRELTELVRETTSRVDCLTDAARRVELRSPNLSEMGGRLGKSSSTSTAPSTLEDGTLNSQVTVSTKPSVEDAKDEPESGQAVKRIASQYTSDGNWQLGRSPPANGALQRPADDQVVKIGIGQNVNVAFGGDVVGGGLKTSSASDRLSLSSDVAADDRQRAESPNLPSELKRFGSFSNLSSQGIMVPEPSISGIVSRAEMDLEQELLSIINTLDGGSSQHSDKVAVEPRRRSACLDDKGEVPSDIQSGPALGMEAMESHTAAPSILKKKSVVDEGETYTKSILKHKDEKSTEGKPPVPPSILKRGSFDDISRHHSPEKTSSILKKRGSSEDSDHRSSSPEVVSILRRRSAEEAEGDYAFGERHSILRRKSAAEESEHSRSILKKQSTVDSTDGVHAEPRPILKKKTSVEETELLDPKPILKKRSSTEEELEERPKPILKVRKRSGQEDIAEDHIRGTSLATSLRMRYLEDESLRLSSTSPRQPSLSSEDDEFHSLPLSPVNWKTRKESDLEEVDDDHRSASRSAWSPIVVPTGESVGVRSFVNR